MRTPFSRCIVLLGFLLVGCGTPSDAPPSLADTTFDGTLRFDANSALVLDDGARRAFDYTLLADGELDEAEMGAWLQASLVEAGRSEAEITSALEAFSAYHRYRQHTATLLADPDRDLAEVRRDIERALDTELGVTPLAAAETERLQHAFAVRDAFDEPDPAARRAALEALAAPTADAFHGSPAGRYLAARESMRSTRESGASEQALTELRRQVYAPYGDAAVERLEVLAERRADFDARIAHLAKAVATHEGPRAEALLAERIERDFPPAEQRRVRGALARYRASVP